MELHSVMDTPRSLRGNYKLTFQPAFRTWTIKPGFRAQDEIDADTHLAMQHAQAGNTVDSRRFCRSGYG